MNDVRVGGGGRIRYVTGPGQLPLPQHRSVPETGDERQQEREKEGERESESKREREKEKKKTKETLKKGKKARG